MQKQTAFRRNIVFVGGIHGVGKGSFCQRVCAQTGRKHLVASEVLKWNTISSIENKKVQSISATQQLLIHGLNALVERDKKYLLDGHFCLLNAAEQVEKVPLETFESMGIEAIIIVMANVALIRQRLKERDGVVYSLDALTAMQSLEYRHAHCVARHLKVGITDITDGNCTTSIASIL